MLSVCGQNEGIQTMEKFDEWIEKSRQVQLC